MIKQILESIKNMLRDKRGKLALETDIESDSEYNKRVVDAEFDDMISGMILLPINVICSIEKGIYRGIKKASEFYQKYSQKNRS